MASIPTLKKSKNTEKRTETSSKSIKPRFKITWKVALIAVAMALVIDVGVVTFLRFSAKNPSSAVFPDNPQLNETRSLVAAHPDDKELHLGLGQSYLNLKHFLSARAEFTEALRLKADEITTLRGRAQANIALERTELAAKDLNRLIELEPANLDNYLILADTQQKADDLTGAKTTLLRIPIGAERLPQVSGDKFAASDRLATAYSHLEDWSKTLSLVESALAIQPDRLGSHIEKGKALHALGRKSEALPYLLEGIKAAPKIAELYYLAGTAYLSRNESGDRDKALDCFQKCVLIDDKHGGATLELAREFERRGMKGVAAFAYQRAYRLGMEGTNPMLHSGDLLLQTGNREEGWYRRGLSFEATGRPDLALIEYRKLTTLHDSCRSGFIHLARVYTTLHDTTNTIKCLQEAAKLAPARASQLQWSFIQAYGEDHKSQRQSDALQKLISNGGKEGEEAQYQMSVIADGSGKFDEAENRLKLCIASSPNDSIYHLNLAKIQLRRRDSQNRLMSAVKNLEAAVRLAPDNSSAYYHLGLAYSYRSENENAILALRHAIDLQPEYGESYQTLAQVLMRAGKRAEAADMLAVFHSFEDFKEAREVLTARCKREPMNPDAHKRMAEFHMRAHEYSGAIQRYNRVLELQPDNRQVRARLAEAYGDMGRRMEQRTQMAMLASAPDKRQ